MVKKISIFMMKYMKKLFEITDLIIEIFRLLIKINFCIDLNLKVYNKVGTSFIPI